MHKGCFYYSYWSSYLTDPFCEKFLQCSQKLPVCVTLKSNSRSRNSSSICQESSSSSAKKLFSALTKLENKTDVVLSYLFVTFFFCSIVSSEIALFYLQVFFPFKLIKLKQLNHCGIYARGKIIEALCPNTTEILAASSRLSHTICFLHHHIFK